MGENTNVLAARRPPGVELMKKLGMAPDPWQVEVLESHSRRILLNCSRQSAACLAYVTDKYDKDFVRKINALIRAERYKEEVFKELTGKTAQELGDEWKSSLRRVPIRCHFEEQLDCIAWVSSSLYPVQVAALYQQ
jgi:hypothetical protein